MFYKCKICGFICNEVFKNCPSCGTDSGQINIEGELIPKNKINFITCDSGDWEVLKLNGKIFAEGHEITPYDWVKLFRQIKNANVINTDIIQKSISYEDMEKRNY